MRSWLSDSVSSVHNLATDSGSGAMPVANRRG